MGISTVLRKQRISAENTLLCLAGAIVKTASSVCLAYKLSCARDGRSRYIEPLDMHGSSFSSCEIRVGFHSCACVRAANAKFFHLGGSPLIAQETSISHGSTACHGSPETALGRPSSHGQMCTPLETTVEDSFFHYFVGMRELKFI